MMIMAGGTGGHVYPALSVAKALREKRIQVVWLGTKKGLEARVIPSEGFDIEWIDASAVVGIQWSRKIVIPLAECFGCRRFGRICVPYRPLSFFGLSWYSVYFGCWGSADLLCRISGCRTWIFMVQHISRASIHGRYWRLSDWRGIGIHDPDLASIAVSNLTLDSRKVESGSLFIAMRGNKADGRDYVSHAMNSGAAAVLVENDIKGIDHFNGICLAIPDLRSKVGVIADRFFDHPSSHLFVIGVTGTNGKTSC